MLNLAANGVWNTALLEASGDPFNVSAAQELRVFTSRQLRRTRRDIHTRADPFLFVDDGWLYLFYEVQRVGEPGYIEAVRTRDLFTFDPIGPVFMPGFHVSYPQVFRHAGEVFMVPETAAAGEVALYRFDSFPTGLRKVRTLLTGRYADCTLFEHAGTWWLFTCSDAGLELFYADSPTDDFQHHPAGVITSAPAFARCGGPVLSVGGSLYRPAQDCTGRYGGNLSMMRIEELTRTGYSESVARRNIFDQRAPWRSLGAHHFSMAEFNGRSIIAVDGQQADYWINRPLSLLLRAASWITPSKKLTRPRQA